MQMYHCNLNSLFLVSFNMVGALVLFLMLQLLPSPSLRSECFHSQNILGASFDSTKGRHGCYYSRSISAIISAGQDQKRVPEENYPSRQYLLHLCRCGDLSPLGCPTSTSRTIRSPVHKAQRPWIRCKKLTGIDICSQPLPQLSDAKRNPT